MISLVVNNDTLNCLTEEQTRLILGEMVICDSYKDSLDIYKLRSAMTDSVIKADSLLINNLKGGSVLCDRLLEKYNTQKIINERIMDVQRKRTRSLEKQRWKIGAGSALGGLVIGMLIGLLAN